MYKRASKFILFGMVWGFLIGGAIGYGAPLGNGFLKGAAFGAGIAGACACIVGAIVSPMIEWADGTGAHVIKDDDESERTSHPMDAHRTSAQATNAETGIVEAKAGPQ